MPDLTPSPDHCPRCSNPFTCRANAIGTCDCARVQLAPDDLAAIRQYTEQTFGSYVCLCNGCLEALRINNSLS
jgi:hypothetical protein